MKTKNLLLLFIAMFQTILLLSQDPKHTIYYKNIEPVNNDKYILTFDNVIARVAYTKLGVKIKNPTNDYLLIKKEKTTFKIGDKDCSPETDWFFIKPNDEEGKTFKVEGETNYHVEKFTLKVDGIYSVPINGKVHKAPNFKLPVETDQVSFGDFVIRVKKISKKTKETQVVFEVEYKGDDVGIVDPSKICAVVPDKGTGEFKNNDRDIVKIKLFNKGDKKSITTTFNIPSSYSDMQYANMEIVWKDAFQSSKETLLKGVTIHFEIDPGMTDAKNK